MVRDFLQKLMKQAAGLAVFSVLAGLLISCSKSGSGRVYLVGESRVVSGLIAAQTGVDLKALKISLIDNQGQRTSPNELKYDFSGFIFLSTERF